MKKLTRRLANALKQFFLGRQRRIQRIALTSEISHTFRRLECRRVLSVTAVFDDTAGIGQLTINIVNDGGNTDAALLVDGNNFYADTDNNQSSAGETAIGVLSSLKQIQVNGAAGGIGTFAWRGDFTASNSLQNLIAQNVNSATIESTATLQNDANISAQTSINFGGDLTLNGNLTAQAVNGTISDSANSSLNVLGNANLNATNITLGSAVGDNMQFGSLTVTSTGAVQIVEDSSTQFNGVNTAGSIDITSNGSIQFNAGSSLTADTAMVVQAIGVDSDIQMDGLVQSNNGDVDLQSADSILFGSTGSVRASNLGNVTLTANTDSSDGNGADEIFMADGSTIQVDGGTIRFSAENAFGGDITLGQLTANSNANTAIDIRTLSNIVDGTALETANLSATSGLIFLSATNGAIGAGAAVADIDINSIRLTFNAPGLVQLTDLAGGIAVTGISSAGGGGFLAANSPLTISADINVGASMIFTAGDSALAGDNLTIDSAAVVTLTSLVAQTLTFQAGDNIVFNTGRIETTGGGLHSVVLSADLDNAGVGAADGDRGSISQDGSASVEVTTNNLTANAATGINIDTNVANLTANNTLSGGIVIRESNEINLTNVVNLAGLIDVFAQGTITAINVDATGTDTDLNDVTLVSSAGDVSVGLVQAGPNFGDVIITAQNNIIDNEPGVDALDIRGNDITLTATTGSIGASSASIFIENVNPLELNATGSFVANALMGLIAIDLDAVAPPVVTLNTNTLWYQSNGDINVAGLLLVTNVALIADADSNGVGTLNLGITLTVTGDLRVEGADIVAGGNVLNPIVLNANRLMVYSGQSETLTVTTTQLDATARGSLTITSPVALELIDLSTPYFDPPTGLDGVALQTLSIDGSILLQVNGAITVTNDVIANNFIVNGTGNILLQSTALLGGDIVVNDIVRGMTGHVSLTANDDIDLNSNISTGGTGTVYLLATNITADAISGVDMQSGTSVRTAGGNVRVVADNEGDILLSYINAGAGDVSLIAERSILDNNAVSSLSADALAGQNQVTLVNATGLAIGDEIFLQATGTANELFTVTAIAGNLVTLSVNLTSSFTLANASLVAAVNVRADALRMVADAAITNASNQVGTIGLADAANGLPNVNRNAIDTVINTLSARSADGIYVQEFDSVFIDATGDITVQEVRFNSTLTARTDLTQSDLVTTDAGPIKLLSLRGDIVANDGNANGFAVQAAGAGDVLLRAAGDIVVNSDVNGTTGHVSLIASDDIDLNANMITSGAGTVYLLAANSGAVDAISGVDMAAGTSITTAGGLNPNEGNVRIEAQNNGDILLGRINAPNHNVSLLADRSILDNNGATLNVQANNLRMVATNGTIGRSDLLNGTPDANINAIDTQVAILAARSATGIYVQELDGVTIDNTGSISTEQVNFNSTRTVVTDASLEDLTTTNNGPIKLQSTTGNIIVNPGLDVAFGIQANGTGDVLLQTQAINGDIIVNAVVRSGTGHISLVASDDIDLNANIVTSGAGTVYLLAANSGALDAISGVDMAAGTSITTAGGLNPNEGNIRIEAQNNGDILLSRISAPNHNVSLLADRSILDNNGAALNVQANNLRMVATTGTIGGSDILNGTPDININAIDTQVSILAARSATGIYVQELDGVTIDNTGLISTEQVNFNSTRTVVTDASLEDLRTTNNGPIKLQSTTGNIVVNPGTAATPGIQANGTGNVLLQTLAGSITLNAIVQSDAGFVSLKSAQDITLNAGVSDASSNLVVIAGQDIVLGITLNVGAGNVYLDAGRSILNSFGESTNIIANNLQMIARTGTIGIADLANVDPDRNVNAIGTDVNFLSARSANGIYVREVNGVTVRNTPSFDYAIVNFNSTQTLGTVTSQSDLETTAAGVIKLVTLAGDITIEDGNANGYGVRTQGGDILLRAFRDVIINSDVRSDLASTSGHITVRAGDDIDLNANIATSGAGTVFLRATNSTVDAISGVDMAAGTSITTAGGLNPNEGNVRIEAQNNGDILLSRISSPNHNVSLLADRSILDNNGAALNVQANNLRMVATTGMIGGSDILNGTPDININAIDTQVVILAARSATGIYVHELDGVTIDNTGSISAEQVNFNSTRTVFTDASLEDLRTTNDGPIKLQSATGNIVVNPGSDAAFGIQANGTGDVVLQTQAANGDIIVNAAIRSGTGHVSMVSGDDIDLNANIATSGAGTVFLRATNSTVDAISGADMATGTSITTAGGLNPNEGNVRIEARNGDILLGRISAPNHNVSLLADRSILDNNGAELNVQANILRMVASTGMIGGSDILNGTPDININAIDTQVVILAARSATGIYVHELDGVTIDNTGSISTEQVNFNSTRTVFTDASLEDLRTTNDGPIKLQSVTGNIVVNPGSDAAFGIQADGTGDVLLQTQAINGDILVNAVVRTGTGHISLVASDDIDLNANISTTGAGTVYLLAANTGSVDAISGVDMAAGTSITTAGGLPPNEGNVRIATQNNGDILLGLINAPNHSVSLLADRSILDNNGAALNVQAGSLMMVATTGTIGGPDQLNGTPDVNINAIDTQVAILAVRSSTGIYVRELDGVVIDNTGPISIEQVNFNSTRTVVNSSIEDLRTTNEGPIKLQSATGNIVVNPGLDVAFGIQANGSGDVLLQTQAANGDIIVNAIVRSGTGHISLVASDDVDLNSNISTSGAGSVYLRATNNTVDAISGVDMQSGTSVRTGGGNVRVVSDNQGDILLSYINAGTGDVSLLAERSILDNNGVSILSAIALSGQNQVTLVNATGLAIGDEIFLQATGTASELFTVTAIAGNVVTLSGNLSSSFTPANAALVAAVNVRADALRMVADDAITNPSNQAGTIGQLSNAIDTAVNTLSGRSADGIFIQEFDSVTVDATGAISVMEVRFNSTRTDRTDLSQSDLVTTNSSSMTLNASPISLTSLRGDITLKDGNADGYAIRAVKLGVFGIVEAKSDITLRAFQGWVDEGDNSSRVEGAKLTLDAGKYVHLGNTVVDSLVARVGTNETLNKLGTTIQVVNAGASHQSDVFLNNLDPLRSVPLSHSQFQFESKYAGDGYSLFLVNQKNLEVLGVVTGATGTSAKPHVYIETSGNSDLNIAGPVVTRSSTTEEGGIVLVAGGNFSLTTGRLETQVMGGAPFTQVIEKISFDRALGDVTYLDARFFDGGQGIEPDSFLMTSTQFVIPATQIAAEKFDTRVNQRVALQFGTANEAGFQIIIGYADGKTQLFNDPTIVTAPAIKGFPSSSDTVAGVFVRSEPFTREFLTANPQLPTNAIIRRSSDFFIFENAAKVNGPEVKDLTFEYKPILNVFSRGVSVGALPPDLPMAKTLVPGTFLLPVELSIPIAVQSHDVELPVTVDKAKIVTIYRIDYDDINRNGQPDYVELPTPEEVLKKLETIKENRDSGVEIKTDGAPTPQQIDAKKTQLLQDPQTRSGAYAIVEKDFDGKESVLEVFPVRDWEEQTSQNSDEPPLVPSKDESVDKLKENEDLVIPKQLPNEKSAYVSPSTQDGVPWVESADSVPISYESSGSNGSSRFASVGLLFGSLWIVRETSKTETSSTSDVIHGIDSIGFSSRDRRNRRLHSRLGK